MAVNKIPNYNRIINLTLKTSTGLNNIKIECPLRGRKPDIEINGTIYTSGILPAFNVTVRNLYLDLVGEMYTELEVEAGYEAETVKFSGTIFSIYQESPNPDGVTVIQCKNGNVKNWLNAMVNINQRKGGSLATVIRQIAQSLELVSDIKTTAQKLTLPVDFAFQGTASQAISRIKNMFPAEALEIYQREKRLVCISISNDKGEGIREAVTHRRLDFLSSLPQQNTGGPDGAPVTTINAPWLPGLACGDILEFPAWVYLKNRMAVNTKVNSNKISVISIQFQFRTVGEGNKMTVMGRKGV